MKLWVLGWLALGMAALTCAAPVRDAGRDAGLEVGREVGRGGGEPPSVTVPPAGSVAESEGGSALAEGAASADGSAEGDSVPPAAVKVPTETPAGIWCATQTCELASELCCLAHRFPEGSVGHCVPKPPPGAPAKACCPDSAPGFCSPSDPTTERACDETADCPKGKRCCRTYGGEGDINRDACATDCGFEICLPGSTCANGKPCAVEDPPTDIDHIGLPARGECPRQIAPPECDGQRCEEGQVCCWSSAARRGTCADRCQDDDDHVFRCTHSDQCGPHLCNSVAGVGRRYFCGGGGWTSGVICKTVKDCPTTNPSLGQQAKLVGCAHEPQLPGGMRVCRYR